MNHTVNDFLETDLGNVSPNPRGEYDELKSYEYLDLVSFEGGSYLCTAELLQAGSSTKPEAGKNTEYWQLITLPGDLTAEYVAMHDRVELDAKQTASDRASVELSEQNVSGMEVNVEAVQKSVEANAAQAESAKESAAGYAATADTSRIKAETAEKNTELLVSGFDVHVDTKTKEAESDIAVARKNAVGVVEKASEPAVNAKNDAVKASESALAAKVASEQAKTESEAAKNGAETAKAKAESAQAAAETASSAAEQTETDVHTFAEQKLAELSKTTADGIVSLQTEGRKQIQAITEAGGGIENALSNYFALRRSNKVFTTKIYKYTTSTSPVGEKMNDNAGMICTPSVGITPGQDDYQQYGLFQHFTCNWHVDGNGFNHVDALEGQVGFSKTGKVQVGEVTMGAWFGLEDTGDAILYHYSAVKSERTPRPMKESINPDGTINPIMIHGKYKAVDIDGMPYSSSGGAPANGCQATQARDPISYTGMIGYMHKLGAHYCGTTCWDLFYLQLMMIIKYATTNSQSIMAGCSNYNYQYDATLAETGVMRVVMAKANATKYVVGSYVSVGDRGEATSKDRYNAYMHNLAYSVKVTKIEDIDDTKSAVYVDAPAAFDVTLTTCVTTMPWHTGSTDEVAGSDGSPGNNTSSIYPCKLQGIEWHVGAYEVLGNVFMDIVTGTDGNPARDVWICENASLLTTNVATAKATYKKAKSQVPYTADTWKYISEETTDMDRGIMIPTGIAAGSNTGFCDGVVTDKATSGQREWLALATLNYGTMPGLWALHAGNAWSTAHWHVLSGVSANGTRGEYQAAA